MEQTRKEYIESEFKKWQENYEIGFQDEFDIKAMLSLQFQFENTPPDHIKTIGDIIHTKNQIMKNLNLKSKRISSSEKIDFLLIIQNEEQKKDLESLFLESIDNNKIENRHISESYTEIVTNKYRIRIKKNHDTSIRGLRANVALKIEDAREFVGQNIKGKPIYK